MRWSCAGSRLTRTRWPPPATTRPRICREGSDDLLRCDASTAASIAGQSTAGLLPPHELALGDFSAGRFGFVMTAMRELPSPIAARGMLGLWTVPPGLEVEIMAQLAGRN